MDSRNADYLQSQLAAWRDINLSQTSSKDMDSKKNDDTPPFYTLPTTPTIEKYIIPYTEKVRDYAATILNTTPDMVLNEKSYLILYNKLDKPISHTPEKSMDKAVIILALGKLDQRNGLQLFKDSNPFELDSGDILATPYSTPQIFQGGGGGLAHMSIWARSVAGAVGD